MNKLNALLNSDRADGRWIAVVAGSGHVARGAVQAGANALIALNAGVFRNLGWGSIAAFMPFADANAQTETLLREHLLPHAQNVPVIAGVHGSVPGADTDAYMRRLVALGVSGVTNWPTVGLADGNFRDALEADGITLANEAQTLKQAKTLGLATVGFVFTPEDVALFLDAGVDAMILSMGMTRGIDDLREKRDQLQQAITLLNRMLAAVKESGRAVPCLAYGGPATTPEDVEQLFAFSGVDGFAGGSVFERLPLQDVTTSVVRRFKTIAVNHGQRKEESGLGQMIGKSAPMRQLFTLIRRIAPYDVNVCIEGESGTGKELIATQIHRMSNRAHHGFVTLNCGAIPETLLESELFGHEKGAFTGAERRRTGKFELAHRGTLFLDEIANLSPHGQVALLRAIQQREISRVGAETLIPVDVRIIAASNQRLVNLVEQGVFRADLFHRLNQVTLAVPPLRERLDDVPLLVDDILSRLQVQLNRKLIGVAPAFLAKLKAHAWSGNVRELQHAILNAALLEDGPVLEGRQFSASAEQRRSSVLISSETGAGAWRANVEKAMREARGNKSRAAAALGVTRKTLYAWLEEIRR